LTELRPPRKWYGTRNKYDPPRSPCSLNVVEQVSRLVELRGINDPNGQFDAIFVAQCTDPIAQQRQPIYLLN
jgi:hypothetical protein